MLSTCLADPVRMFNIRMQDDIFMGENENLFRNEI